ncbi:Ig-like domain-containing protein [Nocardioides panacisoli]|uniref:Ig-like domain-containing protein n=1 Tax=Nocardioides panacisoli TaxID=627624 RepID=UPI0031E4438D
MTVAAPAGAATTDDQRAGCTLVGTGGADHLVGTPGADVICGRGGDDVIRGRGGADIVRGGRGDDTLSGGRGDDELVGGKGDDELRGGAGDDLLKAKGDPAYVDRLGCGTGTDRARADSVDVVAASCEDDGTPGNTAPVAVDDSVTATEDTPVDLPVAGPGSPAANDTDVDGDTLTVIAVSGATGGTVALAGGTITFTPDAGLCGNGAGRFDYTVADGHGGEDTGTVTVDITCVDDPPRAVDDAKTVDQNDPSTAIDVLANDTDADGGPISIASVTQPAHGTVVITGGGSGLTYEPEAGYCNNPPGTALDTFGYTLAPGGSSATVTVTVSCVDQAPHAVDDAASLTEDDPATAVDVLANDTDSDGGPKAIASVTQPSHGTATIVGGGTEVTYAPFDNYCNAPGGPLDTFTYTLSPGGSTATVSMTVFCVDDPPHAADDAKTVTEDDAATAINVRANDTDVEGDPISIASVTQPTHGTVVITGGGTGLTYAPNANYCNTPPGTALDTFTYTVNGGSTATVSVAVTCVDDPPHAVDDAKTVSEDDAATAVDVLANDTDIDGGPMSVASVTQPANGTVVITGGGTGLTYAPNANYCNNPPGTSLDTFTYTLNGGSSATVAITVTCVDDPPHAVDDTKTVSEDAGASAVDVLANDTDSDGGPMSVASVTQPAHGTVVITGGGTGLTYQPSANYCNSPPGTSLDTFTYTLNGGSTATVTVTVTCVDDPPHAVDDAQIFTEGDAATAVDVLANDTDVDGGPMSVASVTQPANGTVVITGGGTGLTYAPNANYCNNPPGTSLDTFTYTLNGGSSATVTITVTCVDDPPHAVDDTKTVSEDAGATAVDVLANDTDSDGGPMSVASVTQPAHGTVVITGGGTGLTYQPTANYCNSPPGTTLDTFTYTLSPGTSSATVTLTVTCVDDPPHAVDDATTVLEDSGATAVDVLANDTDIDGGTKSVASVTQPTDGTVVITGGGTGLTYDPDPNYCNDPPGSTPDTFTYTLNGGSSATVGVTVTCVNDAPVATDESINGTSSAVGNTVLVVDDPTDGAPSAGGPHKSVSGDILANDTDVDGPAPLTITAGTFSTNDGGSVTVQADGDFVFTPAAATSCTDSSDFFDYTVADADGASDVGRVTIAIAGCVWYVSNNAAGNAGTSDAPFNTLAQADAASAANDTIYLYEGDGTTTGYTAGITLKSGQNLVGDGAQLKVGSDVLAAGTAGNRPTITRTGGDVVVLAAGNTVRDLAIDPNGAGSGIAGAASAVAGTIADVQILDTGTSGTQPALDLVGTSGTFAISDLVVDNTAATGQTSGSEGVHLSSAGTVTFDPTSTITIAVKGAKGLDVSSTALGTSTFDSVTVTGSGSGGVSLATVTGTVTFGGLALTTTSGSAGGFVVSNSGTVSVTGTTNTLSSVGGPALSFAHSTIGAADLNFQKVSSSGASNGIVLDTTGNSGSLVVTGNGGTCTNADTSGCTGGTIAGTTGGDDSSSLPVGTGIVLNSTLAPSFTRMWIHDHSNYGVRGTGVSGFTLDTSVVNGSNGTNTVSPYNDAGLAFDNLTGSASVTSTYISGGIADNLRIQNTTGSLDRLTLTSVTFGTNGTSPNNDALDIESSPVAGALKATITNSTFTSAAGDLIDFNHDGTGLGDLVITGSTFSNAHPAIATGGGGLSLFQGGTAGATTMQINGNSFRDAVGPGILVAKLSGSSTQQGKFYNNTIGVSGVANSGSREGSGLKIQDVGGGTDAWSVDGNTIRGYNNFGVEVLAGGGGSPVGGAFDTRVTNNTIAEPGTYAGTIAIVKNGVHYNIGTTPGDTFAACAAITSNTLDQSGADGVPATGFDSDIRLRQRQATTIRLPGYGGANNDNTAVQNFLSGNQNNSGGTTSQASNTVPTGGGFTGGAACSTPTVP